MSVIEAGLINQWRIDLLQSLVQNTFNRATLPTAELFSNSSNLQRLGLLSENGIPSIDQIPISENLAKEHPLQSYIKNPKPLEHTTILSLIKERSIDLSITGFHSGSIPAATNIIKENRTEEDYSKNEWQRDAILTATALYRAGSKEAAENIVKKLWSFLGSEEHRKRVVGFHFDTNENSYRRFIKGENIPHIKFSLDQAGELTWCNHGWGHQQIDAIGAGIWAPYRFANQGDFNLINIDPVKDHNESILVSYIKFLNKIRVWDTLDLGPWEDVMAQSRATSIGIIVAALQQARIFHERNGWDYLKTNYNYKESPDEFKKDLLNVLSKSLEVLNKRIPEDGYAIECERRPFDSSLILLLYPFSPELTEGQQQSILRTVYKNMGEYGFRRWDYDEINGPDNYVGQDYFHNTEIKDKGEFSKVLAENFNPAEWTLFDPLLSGYFYRRYIYSGGSDWESYLYGDIHLKRSLSMITSKEETLYVKGKNSTYTIPSGILPEARAFDSKEGIWRSNHNSPLLMAQAALGLAFERALEAAQLRERLEK